MLFCWFLTVSFLAMFATAANIRLYPQRGCPANGNYFQCAGVGANFCCFRRSPALKSAGLFNKPRASRSAIYARVTNANRCAKQVQTYRSGNRVNVCIGSVNGQDFSFAGAAFFRPGAKKRDLEAPGAGIESRDLAIEAGVVLDERDALPAAPECEGGMEPQQAFVAGKMLDLTNMSATMKLQVDEMVINGTDAPGLPKKFGAFEIAVDDSEYELIAAPVY